MAANFDSCTSRRLDLEDTIAANVAQLDAMLVMTYGDAGDDFRRMNDKIVDAYMWACADKASTIRRALNELTDLRIAESKAKERSPNSGSPR